MINQLKWNTEKKIAPQTDQEPSQQLVVIVILVLSKLPIYPDFILNIKPENLRRITSIKHMMLHKEPQITQTTLETVKLALIFFPSFAV